MNGQAPGNVSETVTQESLLLAAAERIARIREGRMAVHLHLSRLRPQNRQEGHIRIALRMLEPMVTAYRGQMFLFGDSDIVFIIRDPNKTDVENMLFKLRALFSKDPLSFDDSGDGIDHFSTLYDLEGGDYNAFMEMARAANETAEQRGREKRESGPGLLPLGAKDLDSVLTTLSNTDVSSFIRRQSAVIVLERSAEVLFQEFFVAMSDLQRAVSKKFNLLSNRWLFQHLSLTLDALVLDALAEMPFKKQPNAYSLNLNLGTVFSDKFDAFVRRVAGGAKISVEIQVLDVLADSRAYFNARRKLAEAGHTTVIDGLTPLTMKFMDIKQFDADLYKVSWSPEMKNMDGGVLAGIDPESLLLSRCDSETAIRWGLERGLVKFQGRHVDAMLAAYTMAGCEKASACTLQQCIARHGVVTGPLREQCGNLKAMDTSPSVRALRRGGEL